MTILDKLDRVEEILKHQPGRHDQGKHAGTRGGGNITGVLGQNEYSTFTGVSSGDVERMNAVISDVHQRVVDAYPNTNAEIRSVWADDGKLSVIVRSEATGKGLSGVKEVASGLKASLPKGSKFRTYNIENDPHIKVYDVNVSKL